MRHPLEQLACLFSGSVMNNVENLLTTACQLLQAPVPDNQYLEVLACDKSGRNSSLIDLVTALFGVLYNGPTIGDRGNPLKHTKKAPASVNVISRGLSRDPTATKNVAVFCHALECSNDSGSPRPLYLTMSSQAIVNISVWHFDRFWNELLFKRSI